MTDAFSFSIELTQPPADAPAEIVASVALYDGMSEQVYTGRLLADPFKPGEGELLRWYLEKYWAWPYEQFAERAQLIERLLPELGQRLYRAAFDDVEPGAIAQLNIVTSVPAAMNLPWELLHDGSGFLALRDERPVSIARRLALQRDESSSAKFTPPLRILLVTARPEYVDFIDSRSVARELLDEAQGQIEAGMMELEFLRPPTFEALKNRLGQAPPVHVLHFDGHGEFKSKRGSVLFENDHGGPDQVRAEDLARALQECGVHLAVLNACQSASGDLNSVAAKLAGSGVAAVVAMGASVLVVSATRYVEAFYRELAAGAPVTLAHEVARRALHDDPRRHLNRRRIDEQGLPVELHDWWLPQLYQQRPLSLQIEDPADRTPCSVRRDDDRDAELTDRARGASFNLATPPPAPRYGFSGRARELHRIEQWLVRGRVIIIHGFGGVGKTSLACECADWLTRTGLYANACFVSFEHGGDAATLLSALGHNLGAQNGRFDPNEPQKAMAILRPALLQRRKLVIADNLESVLPRGEAALNESLRAELWDTLLELAQSGCGVIMTSRDISFGDERLTNAHNVHSLELGGLENEDAYAFAVRLLEALQIDRSLAPYQQLRDLLEQLGRHPLAIQLVLPSLRDLPMETIRANLADLMPKFADDKETGRNRSLLASLDYSLRRLDDEQRAWLMRLAPFEGGANELSLLEITGIPKEVWVSLRLGLERAALLTPEQVEGFPFPFMRFHPVLSPYLRAQSDANDDSVKSNYVRHYYEETVTLVDEDMRFSLPVRELARLETPNMRRVFELLLESGRLYEASTMATSMGWFLERAMLWRERDALRVRLESVIEASSDHAGAALTVDVLAHESSLGEAEFRRGDINAAYSRFESLLNRIVALSDNTLFGRGSVSHCHTLDWIARCFVAFWRLDDAEGRLHEALAILDTLIVEQSESREIHDHARRLRAGILIDLGEVMRHRKAFPQAQSLIEEALGESTRLGDMNCMGVGLQTLGVLAFDQRDFAAAGKYYSEAIEIFQRLKQPGEEALCWHNLGNVAQVEGRWDRAEENYRASLMINESRGDSKSVAETCMQLAVLAVTSSRPNGLLEAEGWHKRALNTAKLPIQTEAKLKHNFAKMLADAVRNERLPIERLSEARSYAEQSLAIWETLKDPPEFWNILSLLGNIATMEERTEAARDYRHRLLESYVASSYNRHRIDSAYGSLIGLIVAALQGDTSAREIVRANLPQLEASGLRLAYAINRMWAGERDWPTLNEGTDPESALLVLRVLETIAGRKRDGRRSDGVAET